MADSIDLNLGRHAVRLAEQEWGGLKPLGEHLRPLMEEQERPFCEVSGDWYVVSIDPRHAELAKGEIAKLGPVPFLPMVPKRERHGRGSERTTYRPMFGPYLFAKCKGTAENWGRIKSARGVRRLLACEGRPMCISNAQMDVIRMVQARHHEIEAMCAERDEAEAKAKAGGKSGLIWYFSQGDQVRIKNGPFATFYAELEAAVDDHDRVKALINVFGRKSSTDLSAFDIERP